MKILIALLMILQNFYFPGYLLAVPPQSSLFETREIKNNSGELLYVDKSFYFTVQYPKNLHPKVDVHPQEHYTSMISFLDADLESHFAISRKKTEFSSPYEWFQVQSNTHDALVQSGDTGFTKERRPEIVKQEVQDGRDFLTSSNYYDSIDEKGEPLYYKGFITTFIKDGYVYYVNGGLKYDKNTDIEALLADHLKFVHSFHFDES